MRKRPVNALTNGDIHRDFKAEAQVGEGGCGPLHGCLPGIKICVEVRARGTADLSTQTLCRALKIIALLVLCVEAPKRHAGALLHRGATLFPDATPQRDTPRTVLALSGSTLALLYDHPRVTVQPAIRAYNSSARKSWPQVINASLRTFRPLRF